MSVDIYQIIYKGPFSDTSKPIMLIKVGENYHRSNSVSGLIGKNCFCLQCEKGFDHDSKFYKTFETWSWRYRFESSPYYYFAQRWIFQKTSWMVTELFLNLGVMIQSIILLKKTLLGLNLPITSRWHEYRRRTLISNGCIKGKSWKQFLGLID